MEKKTFNRIDPTRTLTLRKAFESQLMKRFTKLIGLINEALIVKDVFGLKNRPPTIHVEPRAFTFPTNIEKINAFNDWLNEQIKNEFFQEVDLAGSRGVAFTKNWTDKYISSAYKNGINRAYLEARKNRVLPDEYPLTEKIPGVKMTREEFLTSAFSSPVNIDAIGMLQLRAYEGLKGITDDMSMKIGRVLSDGLAKGDNPNKIASAISKTIKGIPKNRARMLARTEVVRSFNEAQLNTYESFGMSGVKVMAEWSTAGDDRVCAECEPLDGVVMTISEARGLIPRHPNCRCAWLPANVNESTAGQKRGLDKSLAIEKSLIAELPKKETLRTRKEQLEMAKEKTSWAGKSREMRKARIPYRTGPQARALIEELEQEYKPIKENLVKKKEELKDKIWDISQVIKKKEIEWGRKIREASDEEAVSKEFIKWQKRFESEIKRLYQQRKDLMKREEYISNMIYKVNEEFRNVINNQVIRSGELFDLKITEMPPAIAANKEVKEEINIFRRLLGKRVMKDKEGNSVYLEPPKMYEMKSKEDRSVYESDKNMIGLNVIKKRKGNMIHELGHWLEVSDEDIKDKAYRLLLKHRKSDKLYRLRDLIPGSKYDAHEVAYDTDFFNKYLGKVYRGKRGKTPTTEIISMGLEVMGVRPYFLATKEPDLFDLIFEVMNKGRLK